MESHNIEKEKAADILHACKYAVVNMIAKNSVEYIRRHDGEWHRTAWYDVINEIDRQLSAIETEGGSEDGSKTN